VAEVSAPAVDAPIGFEVMEGEEPVVPAAPAVPAPPPAPPPAPSSAGFDDGFFVDEGSVETPPDEAYFESPVEAPAPAAPAAEGWSFVEEEPIIIAPPEDDVFFVEEDAAPPAYPPAAPAPAPAPAPRAPAPVPAMAMPPAPPPAEMPRVREAAAPRRPAAPPAKAAAPPVAKYAAMGLGALVVLAAVAFAVMRFTGGPKVTAANPQRLHAGERLTLEGSGFAATPAGNEVAFAGQHRARVLEASAARLVVEVPEVPLTDARNTAVPVTVVVGGRSSAAVSVSLYDAPRLHGISPSVAMPGEDVALAGSGWGAGPKVEFGGQPAQVLEVSAATLRVRVPEIAGGPGTSAPVIVVTAAGERSTAAPFLLGRLPMLLGAEPGNPAPGDVVTVSGRGFHFRAAANQVRVGEHPALVVAATDSELKFVVPFADTAGETPFTVRVPNSENVAQAVLTLPPLPETAELRYVAVPMSDAAGHEHAALATPLGPAFVLTASGGRSAADRALVAQRRLNEAAHMLRSNLGEDLEARALETAPAVGMIGQSEPVLEVTEEDAAAYDEDSRRLGARVAVTRPRLAVWWAAVARDLTMLLARSERPRQAAALAPEGRVLGELYDLAHRGGRFDVPRDVLSRARPAQREAFRLLALRVPSAVTAPAAASAAAGAAAPTPSPEAFTLPGDWTGFELEGGERRFVTITFTERGGQLAFQRALALTMPVTVLEVSRRGNLRFSLQTARGVRYYAGSWDGQKLKGRIATDPSGASAVGTFELERR
jgi:hypothetical protein